MAPSYPKLRSESAVTAGITRTFRVASEQLTINPTLSQCGHPSFTCNTETQKTSQTDFMFMQLILHLMTEHSERKSFQNELSQTIPLTSIILRATFKWC